MTPRRNKDGMVRDASDERNGQPCAVAKRTMLAESAALCNDAARWKDAANAGVVMAMMWEHAALTEGDTGMAGAP
eukprot:395933-Prymnesium_polylepis.1